MTMLGIAVGTAIIFYGLVTIIIKRSILFGGNLDRYTEGSVRLFARFSGIFEIITGLGVILYNVSTIMPISYFARWFCLTIIWLAITAIFTFYLTVLVKKHS